MATFIYRYAKKYNITLEETYFPAKSFSDAWNISDFAKEAVELMRLTGIVTGTDKGEFLPKNGATRAEAATVFMRFIWALPLDWDEAVEGVDYKVLSSKVTIQDDVEEYCWVRYVAEIKNTSTKNLFVQVGSVDIDKADGSPLDSMYCYASKAEVICPGETMYLNAIDLYENLDTTQQLKATLRPSVYTASVSKITLPVSNFSITDNSFGWIDAAGKVTNTTSEKVSIQVDMIYKDKNGDVIGVDESTILDVAPGDTVNFKESATLLPDGTTTKTISACEVYAYPIQYQ